MSVGLNIRFDDLGSAARIDLRLLRLAKPNMRDLLEGIGSEIEAQTRTRIQDEKKAPDGTAWDDWSEDYAGSRHGKSTSHDPHPGQLRSAGGHTLLQLGGDLLDSIQFDVAGSDEVLIGSNLVYANRMNEQRQYLGLSPQNVEDLEELVIDFMGDLLK